MLPNHIMLVLILRLSGCINNSINGQSIGFSPIVCFVALGFFSRFNKLRSKYHLKPKLGQLWKITALFCFLRSQSSHAHSLLSLELPIQHAALFRFSAFSSSVVFRSMLIWWSLLLSAIKVSSLRLLQIKERLKAVVNFFLAVSRYYPYIPFR